MRAKHFAVRRSLLALAIVGSLSMVSAYAQPQAAAQVQQSYDVAAGPLADVLAKLAQEVGGRIVFDPQLVANKTSLGVRGSYTREDALREVLQGSGLAPSIQSDGTLSVQRAKRSTRTTSSYDSAGQHGTAVAPSPAFGGVTQLSEVKVVAQAENTYNVDSSNGATRTDTDLINTPQSVSVITRKLMDDQQAQTLDDALANASGVLVNGNAGGSGTSYTVRGYGNATVMSDGMVGNGLPSSTPIWGVDSVEVLKGPESILQGSASGQNFGGVINIVAKQPQVTPVADLMAGFGSYGQAQSGFDFGGALTANKELSYRFVGEYDHTSNNVGGYDSSHQIYLAPSLRWSNGDTSLLVGAERTVKSGPLQFATIAPGPKIDDTAPIRVIGAKEDGADTNQTRVYYKFEQSLFGDNWSFRSRGQYQNQDQTQQLWYPEVRLDRLEQGDILLGGLLTGVNLRSIALQNDIHGTFSTGPISHEVVIGSDFSRTDTRISLAETWPAAFNIFTSPQLPSVSSSLHTTAPLFEYSSLVPTSEVGYLFQDQMSYGDHWHALFALRDAIYHNYAASPDVQKWLPNIGVLYAFTPDISAYVNSMKGYYPNNEINAQGGLLPPQTSSQYEAGLKFDLMNKKLSLTTAAYKITVSNTALSVPGTVFYTLGPGQTSRGAEVELKGQFTPGLDLSTTFTHIDATTNNGTPVLAVPKNTATFWGAYRFRSPVLRNFGVGLGVFARGASTNYLGAYDPITFQPLYMKNPGNVRVDAHVSYTKSNWSLNFGIRDVFDRRIYSVDAQGLYAGVTDIGRTYLLTAKISL